MVNEISALKNLPYINLLSLIVKKRPEKSGVLKMAAIKGVIISATSEFTTAPNAVPMTTPTARSTTFPRKINCLNPSNIYVVLNV